MADTKKAAFKAKIVEANIKTGDQHEQPQLRVSRQRRTEVEEEVSSRKGELSAEDFPPIGQVRNEEVWQQVGQRARKSTEKKRGTQATKQKQ